MEWYRNSGVSRGDKSLILGRAQLPWIMQQTKYINLNKVMALNYCEGVFRGINLLVIKMGSDGLWVRWEVLICSEWSTRICNIFYVWKFSCHYFHLIFFHSLVVGTVLNFRSSSGDFVTVISWLGPLCISEWSVWNEISEITLLGSVLESRWYNSGIEIEPSWKTVVSMVRVLKREEGV